MTDEVKRTLERRLWAMHVPIDVRMLNATGHWFLDDVSDTVHVQFRAQIWGERVGPPEVELVTRESFPINWWHALRAALFPNGDDLVGAWINRRWPVRRQQHRFTVTRQCWANYPLYEPIPNAGRHALVTEIEGREVTDDE